MTSNCRGPIALPDRPQRAVYSLAYVQRPSSEPLLYTAFVPQCGPAQPLDQRSILSAALRPGVSQARSSRYAHASARLNVMAY